MSIRWNDLVPSYLTRGKYLDETKYEYFIEHDGIGAHSLQALASDILDMTPKQERDLPQAYGLVKYDSTTPPLSPSTTISSLPTEEQYSWDEPELVVSREEVKKGKQPETPVVSLDSSPVSVSHVDCDRRRQFSRKNMLKMTRIGMGWNTL
jgi:hypothetical protein